MLQNFSNVGPQLSHLISTYLLWPVLETNISLKIQYQKLPTIH